MYNYIIIILMITLRSPLSAYHHHHHHHLHVKRQQLRIDYGTEPQQQRLWLSWTRKLTIHKLWLLHLSTQTLHYTLLIQKSCCEFYFILGLFNLLMGSDTHFFITGSNERRRRMARALLNLIIITETETASSLSRVDGITKHRICHKLNNHLTILSEFPN